MSLIKVDTLSSHAKKEINIISRMDVPHFYYYRIHKYKDVASSIIDNDLSLLKLPSTPNTIQAETNFIARKPKAINIRIGITYKMSTSETTKNVKVSFVCIIDGDVGNSVTIWETFVVLDDDSFIYKVFDIELDASKFSLGSHVKMDIFRDNTVPDNHAGDFEIHGLNII